MSKLQVPIQNWVKHVFIPLFLTLTITVITIFFGQLKSNYFSAYATCQNTAINTKGYSAWKHINTTPFIFLSEVTFSDGYNVLSCYALGIGPFWVTGYSTQTLVGCINDKGLCSEEYFGIAP